LRAGAQSFMTRHPGRAIASHVSMRFALLFCLACVTAACGGSSVARRRRPRHERAKSGTIRPVCLSAIVLALLSVAVDAVGSDEPDRAPYAGVNVLLSMQDPGVPGYGSSVPRAGIGGTTLGVSVDGGAFVTAHVSVAVEVSIPARFDAVQFTAIPRARIERHHRDGVASALLHLHAPALGPVDAAFVGGPSIITENTLSQTAYGSFGSTTFGTPEPEVELARTAIGITFGGDVAVRVQRHVAFVAGMRWLWVERKTLGDSGAGIVGLSPWVTRPAIGVRAMF
jgi:hypothetical protein